MSRPAHPLSLHRPGTADTGVAFVRALGHVLTTIEGGPSGAAWVLQGIGVHLVDDVTRFFRFATSGAPGVEREEFDDARRRLAAAGYALTPDADAAWAAFARRRTAYAAQLNALAGHLAVPPAQWIGDRSEVRH